ncbi:MAG: putative metal-binding motif-containing protein [Flavobacteriales bacterium]|nr:putative metal-binding motif-containing protein [Flavobacteriales bacterium]
MPEHSPCNAAYENCTGLIDNDNDGAYVFEDCDDADASIYTNAPELCDGLDNDCDGQADEDAPLLTVYLDLDGDGYGTDASQMSICPAPPGYVTSGGDCDDDDVTIHPDSDDVCDDVDNDCDGQLDEDGPIWFYDLDGDGFGIPETTMVACTQPMGFAPFVGDCDDQNNAVNPGTSELCDGIDNNCDGDVDENAVIPTATAPAIALMVVPTIH